MKKNILLTLIFTSVLINNIFSQNLLTSLYELDNFPKEMENAKKFINKTCSEILIYNYSPSQFEIRKKNGIKIDFPLKDELSLSFIDDKTNEQFKTYTVHYDFNFKYAQFYHDYKIRDSIFSLPLIFETATKYFNINEYEIVVQLSSLEDGYRTMEEYENKRILFYEDLANNFNLDKINFKEILKRSDGATDSVIEEKMLSTIMKKLSYEERKQVIPYLFKKHIYNEKSESKTKGLIDFVFNRDDVVNIIEKEVLQPKAKIYLNDGGYLNLPKKHIEVKSLEVNSFPINLIDVSIDFKEKVLKIDFENDDLTKLTINKSFHSDKKVKRASIESNRIRLEISDKETTLKIFKYGNNETPYVIKIK